MAIGEEVITQLMQFLKDQEQKLRGQAELHQVNAHKCIGSYEAIKQIADALIMITKELSDKEATKIKEEVKERPAEPTPPSPFEIEVEARKKKGSCCYKPRGGEFCNNKKTKATDYCRKHNKELGLTNG